MLILTSPQRTALEQHAVERRLFIWCNALNPSTGLPDPAGFWNDVGTVEHAGRIYHPGLFQIEDLAATSNLTIPGLRITLSLIEDPAIALVRGSVVAQRPIEVHVGIFNTATKALIDGLIPRFRGFVDDVDIHTPPAGGIAQIVLTCESTSRQLTIKRTETRSEASAEERRPGDGIFRYTGLQREKPLFFGRQAPR